MYSLIIGYTYIKARSMTIRTNYEEVEMLRGIKHTVLLIEADRSLRRLITLGLQYRGMYVIEASSPTSIPTLQSQLPDVVVLDIDSEVGSRSEERRVGKGGRDGWWGGR